MGGPLTGGPLASADGAESVSSIVVKGAWIGAWYWLALPYGGRRFCKAATVGLDAGPNGEGLELPREGVLYWSANGSQQGLTDRVKTNLDTDRHTHSEPALRS